MANQKPTVTLPALPAGRCYVSIASELIVRLACSAGSYTIRPAKHTEAIVDGTYAYGFRQCAGDGGAMGKDASDNDKTAGVLKRAEAIDDGSHAYGAGGGGARLSTYTVVLRENVLAELIALGNKRGDVIKDVVKDPALAYVEVAESFANGLREDVAEADKDKVTTESVLAVLWPKLTAKSKTEAARRDKESGKGIEPDSDMLAAVLAKATESEDNPADESSAIAA